jgi:Carboxypeptidase regulatory-like domain
MLTQSRTNRLSALSATLFAGLVTLPLVVAFAVDPEQTSKAAPKGQQSAGAQAAILRGRVTDEAGAPLVDVRVRVAIPAADMRFVDASTQNKRRLMEAKSDAKGDYRLELPEITEHTTISIDAMKPGYRRLVGTLMSGGDAKRVEVAPGTAAEASLVLKPALYFTGIVVDEQGRPISAVKIAANVQFARASAGIELTASNSDGAFELFCYSVNPPTRQNEVSKGEVHFVHPDYIDREIEDVYALAPKERDSLRIILAAGYKVTGRVVDDAGKPVANAMIRAIRKDKTHRKGTTTDASGSFALRGVSGGLIMVTARALDIRQQAYVPIALKSDKLDLEIRLKPIELPADLKTYPVLGMQLADVTPELRSTYDLYSERRALIVDPGKDPDRLNIGRLAEGYAFWKVGNTRIGSVSEFVSQIVAETAGQNAAEYSVRVVYNFSAVDFDGSRTAYLKFTKDDLKQLQTLSEQLAPESR